MCRCITHGLLKAHQPIGWKYRNYQLTKKKIKRMEIKLNVGDRIQVPERCKAVIENDVVLVEQAAQLVKETLRKFHKENNPR